MRVQAGTAWNLRALRDAINDRYGRTHLDLVNPSLGSLVVRQRYAEYHYRDLKRLMRDAIDESAEQRDVTLLVLADQTGEFGLARFKAEAHLVACLESLHAIADLLAFVAYGALDLRSEFRSERDVNFASVARVVGGRPEWSEISALMEEFETHADNKYLVDVVNHSKHRRVVGAAYHISFVMPQHGLQIEAFQRDGRFYPARFVDDFVPVEFARRSRLMCRIGRCINRSLGAQE